MHLGIDEGEVATGKYFVLLLLLKKCIHAQHLEKSQNEVSVNDITGAFETI